MCAQAMHASQDYRKAQMIIYMVQCPVINSGRVII